MNISNHFFKPANAGKDILFYLTQQDLIKITRQYFSGTTDKDANNIKALKKENWKVFVQIYPMLKLVFKRVKL